MYILYILYYIYYIIYIILYILYYIYYIIYIILYILYIIYVILYILYIIYIILYIYSISNWYNYYINIVITMLLATHDFWDETLSVWAVWWINDDHCCSLYHCHGIIGRIIVYNCDVLGILNVFTCLDWVTFHNLLCAVCLGLWRTVLYCFATSNSWTS